MPHTHSLRSFEPSPAEYKAIVAVYNHANPDRPGSVETWQHWDQHRDPAKFFTRYVVERKGEIGGYGFSVRTDPAAHKFRFAIYLLPEWETGDLINQFYSYISDRCLERNPSALLCQTHENEAGKIAWLKEHGFQLAMRYPLSILTLADFDPTPYAGLKAKIRAEGLEIISIAELATREPDWQRKIYDLEMLLSHDVPRPSTFAPPPFEQYVQGTFSDPGFLPQAWLVALDGDLLVGTANLYKAGDSIEILETDLTAVRRQYRRRGLATLLKCQVLEVAQQLGARRVQTSNEENNPMFQLNLRLGFQAKPADVDWEKVMPMEY